MVKVFMFVTLVKVSVLSERERNEDLFAKKYTHCRRTLTPKREKNQGAFPQMLQLMTVPSELLKEKRLKCWE